VELIALSQFWDFFWVVKTRQVPVAQSIAKKTKMYVDLDLHCKSKISAAWQHIC
jgi:hypothetical protein